MALPLSCALPACTYLIAPLDDVKVFDGSVADTGPEVGEDTRPLDDTAVPDSALPDTAIADSSVPDTSADSGADAPVDTAPCDASLSPLPARATVGPDSPHARLVDLDGDGKLDLVTTSRMRNSVQVLKGAGDGSFAAYVESAASVNPVTFVVGDLNGDAKLDVVTTSSVSSTTVGALSVMLGGGTLSFPTRVSYPTGLGTTSVALGDATNDGKVDLFAVNLGDNTLNVLVGIGDGTFPTKTTVTLAGLSGHLAVGDLNGDGKADAVVGQADGNAGVLLGNGDGTFATSVPYFLGGGPLDLLLVDVNKDGKLDLVATIVSGSQEVAVLLGKGDGTFLPKANVLTGPFPAGLAVADLDGDGKLDVAVSCPGDSSVTVHRGNGDGTLKAAEVYATFVDAVPIGLAAGDLDKDGRVDLVALDDVLGKTITMHNVCK